MIADQVVIRDLQRKGHKDIKHFELKHGGSLLQCRGCKLRAIMFVDREGRINKMGGLFSVDCQKGK